MVRAMFPLSMVSVRAPERHRNLQVHHTSAGSSWARDGRADVLLLDGTGPSAAGVALAQVRIQAAGCGVGGRLPVLNGDRAVRTYAEPRGGFSVRRYSSDLLQSALYPQPLY